jgi:hypothetical protein
MAPTSKYQFSYPTRLNPNADEVLQEPAATLKVTYHSQKMGKLVEFHRLFNFEFDNEQHSAQLSWIFFDSYSIRAKIELYFQMLHIFRWMQHTYLAFFNITRTNQFRQTNYRISKASCISQMDTNSISGEPTEMSHGCDSL